MQILVAAGAQLGNRVLVGPALVIRAVDGTEGAGAVNAGKAMNQNRIVLGMIHDLSEALYPLVGGDGTVGRPPGARGNAAILDVLGVTVVLLTGVRRRTIRIGRVPQGNQRLEPVVMNRGFQTPK